MQKRRLFVILTALILSGMAYLCSTLVLASPVVQAHAYVIGSDPVDGSTINTLPAVVRIFFNAAISPISTAHVYAAGNTDLVDIGAAPSFISPLSSRELDIPIKTPKAQPQGSYEVRWEAVANDDAHTTYGLIGFNLGVSSNGLTGTPTLGPTTSNSIEDIQELNVMSILAIVWEWLARVALALWIGILVIERFVLRGSEDTIALASRIKRQTYSLQWLCLGTLFCGEIIALILRSNTLTRILTTNGGTQSINTSGFSFAFLPQFIMETNYGHFLLLRMVLIVIAMGLLYWMGPQRQAHATPEPAQRNTAGLSHHSGPLKRITQEHPVTTASISKELQDKGQDTRTSSRVQRFLSGWLLLAGLIVLTQALSTTSTSQLHISTIVFDWLNRIGEGAWFGGMAYLAYVVLPFLPKSELERRAETVALLLRRLVPYLLFCISIVLVSVLFSTEASISNMQQLLNDPYGRSQLVQIIAIALILLLSLYALFILNPRFMHQAIFLPVVNADLPARRTRQSALERTWGNLKQVMAVQSWLGAGALLCAAFMVFYAPPIVFPNINYSNPTITTSASNTSTIQTKQVGNLTLTLQILPGHSNTVNTAILLIADQTGTPITNAHVLLDSGMQIMNMGTAHKTLEKGNPVYAISFGKGEAFTMAGVWLLNVTIQVPGQSSLQTTFQVNIT